MQPLLHDPCPRSRAPHVRRRPQSSCVFDPIPAIFPGYVAPVVRKAADGERELVTMNWDLALLKDRAPKHGIFELRLAAAAASGSDDRVDARRSEAPVDAPRKAVVINVGADLPLVGEAKRGVLGDLEHDAGLEHGGVAGDG